MLFVEFNMDDALAVRFEEGLEEGRIKTLRVQIEAKRAKGKSRAQIIDELELTPVDVALLGNF